MTFDPRLKQGETISNQELRDKFKCGARGGMRRSHTTNTLVLISDHTRGVYQDRWKRGVLHYTGMGLEGDQSIGLAQNKTLAESTKTGIQVFLFEVFESGKYLYQGRVRLAGKPLKGTQPDESNRQRLVWIFPLKLVDFPAPAPIPEEAFDQAVAKRERNSRKLSEDDLRKRVEKINKSPQQRAVSGIRYETSEELKELAKRKAKGKCMLCGENAPFADRDNQPYLEEHHIIWLSLGGPDTENNVVALCPNCHRKMHVLDLKADRDFLRIKAR